MNVEPKTPQEWAAWLESEELRSLRLYTEYPERLVSDSNQERQVARDYAGREVLELLQNANDAATDAGKRGRVRIELSTDGLIVANEGAPFTREGVESLKLANFSPKRSRKRQMVGNKGLGFRAVLNWTRTPLVLSEGLALAFSAAAAHAQQERLAAQSEKLSALIAEEQRSVGPLIVPLLAFPGFKPDGDIGDLLDNPAQKVLHARARELQTDGFSTVIVMPFNDAAAALAELRKQLAQLRPEVLLFARSIAMLEIAEVGKPLSRWRHELAGAEASLVHVSDTETRKWRIFHRDGAVPKRLCPPDRPAGMDYEVVVAVPTDHTAQEGVLYSYFPTELPFPYPVVAHATLDLQANRQQPQDTKANHFIFRRLARLMAEAAQALAHDHDTDSGLLLLSMRALTDPLEKFHFRKRLCRFARQCVIVPTAAAGLVKAPAARRTKFADTAWLPRRYFTNVARVGSDRTVAVLAWLNVKELGLADWTGLTKRLEFESIAERAEYIAGLVRHQVKDAMEWGGLLLDSDGNPVPRGHKVFVGATVQSSAGLPTWFESHFLHDGLRTFLQDLLKLPKQDAFLTALAPLNVSPYSLSNVIESLLSQARQRVKDEPSQEDVIRLELTIAIHALFPVHELPEKRPQFPTKAHVFLRTQAGTFEDARKLYISSFYGVRGRVLEDLYGAFAPQKLLAGPESHGLSGSSETLVEFFRWLGVADAPRDVRLDSTECGFLDHVRRHLPSPLVMEDYDWVQGSDFDGHCSEAASLDDLPQILERAPAAAVLAWLAHEPRAQSWKEISPAHGILSHSRSYAKRARNYTAGIPSFIRWKLQTTSWIPARNGLIVRPSDCVIESVPAVAKLLPTPTFPSPQELSHYGIGRGHLFVAWDNAGVLPGLSHLEADQLYDLLASLPQRDPGGEAAKSVYEAVLRRFNEADVRDSEGRKRWGREGRILARDGSGVGYFDVKKVWRLGAHELPLALRRLIPVAEISRGVAGGEKVEALLGVRSVKAGQIVRKIRGYTPALDADAAASDFDEVKVIIGYLRKTDRARRALERLSLKLCSAITGEVEFLGHAVPLELGCWGWVLDDETDTAYLRTDTVVDSPLDSPFFAHSVGEIFAEVFGLESGAEFAQLAQCRRSEDRVLLLGKLLGDENVPGLEELKRKLRERTASEQEMIIPAEGLLPPTIVQSPPRTPILPQPTASPTVAPTIDAPLQIQPVPHIPTAPATIAVRVTRTVQVESPNITVYERVRGDFWEAKVMEFEAQCGRFPLHVGRIIGWNGPRVDVVSFDSADLRSVFEAAEQKDADLVARFIEVKGRRDGGAKIDLRDNELDAARVFGERYYLYRVSDGGNGAYSLAMLRDPLSAGASAKRFVQVDLDGAATTERVNLIGGRTEAGYLRELDSAAATNAAPSP